MIVLSSDRAGEEFSNSTATAVSVDSGMNVTSSVRKFDLTFYLSIYSGKPIVIPVVLVRVFGSNI